MTTTISNAYQKVEHGTIQCRKFFRKVQRDNLRDYSHGWCADASEETDWCLEFRRTVSGGVGEPDVTVRVKTDIQVSVPPDSRLGEVRSFSDSDAVTMPRPRRIFVMSYNTTGLASLLLNKHAALKLQASSGSTSSSRHGLGFYDLMVRIDQYNNWVSYSQTVTKDGQAICGGVVNF